MDCKVVLLGQENAGKSCLVDRFVYGRFDRTAAVATVGASYAAKKVNTENGEVVVSLWDTAGAERFESLSRLYYSGAEAAIICLDPTDASSFPKTQFWVREVKEHQPECRCYIVLCKCDMLETPPKELPPETDANEADRPPASKADDAHPSNENSESQATLRDGSDTQGDSANASQSGRPASPEQGRGGQRPQPSPSPKKPKLVSDSQLQMLAANTGAKIAATSARTGAGVQELFEMVARDLAGVSEGVPQLPRLAIRSGDSLSQAETPQATPRLSSLPSTARSRPSDAVQLRPQRGQGGSGKGGCCAS